MSNPLKNFFKKKTRSRPLQEDPKTFDFATHIETCITYIGQNEISLDEVQKSLQHAFADLDKAGYQSTYLKNFRDNLPALLADYPMAGVTKTDVFAATIPWRFLSVFFLAAFIAFVASPLGLAVALSSLAVVFAAGVIFHAIQQKAQRDRNSAPHVFAKLRAELEQQDRHPKQLNKNTNILQMDSMEEDGNLLISVDDSEAKRTARLKKVAIDILNEVKADLEEQRVKRKQDDLNSKKSQAEKTQLNGIERYTHKLANNRVVDNTLTPIWNHLCTYSMYYWMGFAVAMMFFGPFIVLFSMPLWVAAAFAIPTLFLVGGLIYKGYRAYQNRGQKEKPTFDMEKIANQAELYDQFRNAMGIDVDVEQEIANVNVLDEEHGTTNTNLKQKWRSAKNEILGKIGPDKYNNLPLIDFLYRGRTHKIALSTAFGFVGGYMMSSFAIWVITDFLGVVIAGLALTTPVGIIACLAAAVAVAAFFAIKAGINASREYKINHHLIDTNEDQLKGFMALEELIKEMKEQATPEQLAAGFVVPSKQKVTGIWPRLKQIGPLVFRGGNGVGSGIFIIRSLFLVGCILTLFFVLPIMTVMIIAVVAGVVIGALDLYNRVHTNKMNASKQYLDNLDLKEKELLLELAYWNKITSPNNNPVQSHDVHVKKQDDDTNNSNNTVIELPDSSDNKPTSEDSNSSNNKQDSLLIHRTSYKSKDSNQDTETASDSLNLSNTKRVTDLTKTVASDLEKYLEKHGFFHHSAVSTIASHCAAEVTQPQQASMLLMPELKT